MKRSLLLVAVAAGLLVDVGLVVSIGRAPDGHVSAEHIVNAGVDRMYRVFTPSHLAGGHAKGLVFALHGYTGDGAGFEGYSGLDAEAIRFGLITVYPDGFAHSWNAGSCCGDAARMDLDDVGFIAALAAHLETQYSIDAAHVYAAGFSNGAMLALRIACERPSLVSAVAAVAGELEVQDCASGPAVAMLLVHGSADRLVQFPGLVAGTSTTVFDWALSRNGCSDSSVAISGRLSVWKGVGCPQSASVTEYELAGGPHAWPNSSELRAGDVVGSFFASH